MFAAHDVVYVYICGNMAEPRVGDRVSQKIERSDLLRLFMLRAVVFLQQNAFVQYSSTRDKAESHLQVRFRIWRILEKKDSAANQNDKAQSSSDTECYVSHLLPARNCS